MAELTYDPTPADQGEFNESELEALKVGEAQAEAESKKLAGKFEDAEQLEKAYLELQSKLGEKESAETSESEEQEKPAEDDGEVGKAFFDALEKEISSGEISEDSWKQIEQMDPRQLTEKFIEWNGAEFEDLSEAQVVALKQSVGGDKAYDDLMKWSNENLPEQYVEAFDGIVESGDVATIELVLSGLVANYQNSNGYEGRMTTGKQAANKAEVFRSQAEVVAAMNDPRYDNDPAYRADVFNRLERSNLEY
jgi:hypothetical protein